MRRNVCAIPVFTDVQLLLASNKDSLFNAAGGVNVRLTCPASDAPSTDNFKSVLVMSCFRPGFRLIADSLADDVLLTIAELAGVAETSVQHGVIQPQNQYFSRVFARRFKCKDA